MQEPSMKTTGLKTGFKFNVNGKDYTDENTNHYQKIIMLEIARQQTTLDELIKEKSSEIQQAKQQGVVEHYVQMLMLYDNIQEVDHLFPGAYDAAILIQREGAAKQREQMQSSLCSSPSK